jgi:predicted SAM-dependent methyltransferase
MWLIDFGKRWVKSTLAARGLDIVSKSAVFNESLAYRSYPKESLDSKRFLNIGAGSFFNHPNWSRLDYIDTPYFYTKYGADSKVEINHDLSTKADFPIDSESLELVYTSHTIEHLEYEMVSKLFGEAFRTLKCGGGFRVTCPDMNLHLQALFKDDKHFYYWIPSGEHFSQAQHFLKNFASPLADISIEGGGRIPDDEIIDRFRSDTGGGYTESFEYFSSECKFNPERVGDHISWWTRGRVVDLMKKVGFSEVYVSGHSQSRFPPLRDTSNFDTTQVPHSLYIEARK